MKRMCPIRAEKGKSLSIKLAAIRKKIVVLTVTLINIHKICFATRNSKVLIKI